MLRGWAWFSNFSAHAPKLKVKDGGKTLLDYPRFTPANPFMVGGEPETVHHRFPL